MHPTNQFYLCSSFVALSMQNSCSSITAGAGGHMHPDEDCVFEVSFDVPQDANARLGRFLKQYRVEVVAVKEEQSGLRELDKGGTSGHKQDGKKGLGGGGGRAGWRFFCANERLW